MRNAFFSALSELAQTDKDLYLLSADVGFRLLDGFREAYPERFIDVGVAESNMIGIAAGMSLAGKHVYCYSMVPFLILRAYEQIRIDVAYHNLNVRLVGAGGGVCYGLEGFTHFAVEDLALMRALPNMTIVCPADAVEARCVARRSCTHAGPLYIRFSGNGEQPVHNIEPNFEIGKAIVLQKGREIALFATGGMVHAAKEAGRLLGSAGIHASIIDMHTIKPLDVDAVLDIACTHKAIFSVEEHSVVGGLGSAIGEVLAEHGYAGMFRRFGIPDLMPQHIGTGDYLRGRAGLTPRALAGEILTYTGQRRYGIAG